MACPSQATSGSRGRGTGSWGSSLSPRGRRQQGRIWASRMPCRLEAAPNLSHTTKVVSTRQRLQGHGCEVTGAKLSPVLRWLPRKLLMRDSPRAQIQVPRGLESERAALLAVSETGHQFLEGRCCLMSESLLKSERSTEGREVPDSEEKPPASVQRTKGRVCY